VITVIIPTYNAGRRFAELLDGLQKQTLKPEQILVVDTGSTDETCKAARDRNCTVNVIKRSDFDHGTTRNLAASRSQGEFMVFLSQDAVPADERMIDELIKPMMADPNIAVCYGRQIPRPNAGPLERFAREFNYPEESVLKNRSSIKSLGMKTFFCSNSCSAFRRSIFNELGGFKNNVIVNEDMLYAAQAILKGYSVYYSAAAKVCHSHPFGTVRTFKRYFNIGRFFAENRRILKQAGLGRYSGDMIKAGMRTFWRKRTPYYMAALLFEFIVKAIACKLGWFYQPLFHKRSKAGVRPF
jgi:rhamnosyltransferase